MKPWPELDAVVAGTLDSQDSGYELLRGYVSGELEIPEGKEDELREDFVKLVDILHENSKGNLGKLYQAALLADEYRENFLVLSKLPPERFALIQKAAGITPVEEP